jgi:hypothetical protein
VLQVHLNGIKKGKVKALFLFKDFYGIIRKNDTQGFLT